MSYCVSLNCPTCNDYTLDENITSNVAPMWHKAGIDLHEYNKKKAVYLIVPLTKAIENMALDPEGYKEMNPANGWGDYDSALEFLQKILSAVYANPNSKFEVNS